VIGRAARVGHVTVCGAVAGGPTLSLPSDRLLPTHLSATVRLPVVPSSLLMVRSPRMPAAPGVQRSANVLIPPAAITPGRAQLWPAQP
jgi:hypothetical protein